MRVTGCLSHFRHFEQFCLLAMTYGASLAEITI